MKSVFIVMEGPDGSGKTTQAHRLVELLESERHPAEFTREPWDEDIRKRLAEVELTPDQELELFLRDRKMHVAEVIKPALARGRIVVCDRFSPSTLAYQVGGLRMDRAAVERADNKARGNVWPDIVFLFDGRPEVFKRRIEARSKKMHLFEMRGLDFHRQVRSSYLAQARQDSRRWRVINAEQEPDAVFADVVRHLRTHPAFRTLGL